MQLPPASAASPRLPSSGPATASHSGSPAGFDAVMGGVLASGAKASGKAPEAKEQPASDDGGPGKSAADGSGTVAHPGESRAGESHAVESRLGESRQGEQGEAKGAKGSAEPASAAASAGVCAPSGLAIAGIAAAQGIAPGPGSGSSVVPGKEGVSAGTAPLGSIAGTSATGNVAALAGGSASGGPGLATQPTTQPVTLPENAGVPSGPGGVAMLAGSTLSSGNAASWGNIAASKTQGAPSAAPALPAGNAGAVQLTTVQPGTIQPGTIPPGTIHPGTVQPGTAPVPSVPSVPSAPVQPITASSASPAPVGTKTAPTATAALADEAGTAVVLPPRKPGTQQDPQQPGGQGIVATAAGTQAGFPAITQPASPLQQVPSPATPGMATPAPQADPAKLLPQVAGRLFSLAAADPGKHVMTLRLSPEDLGPLTVRAHIDGSGVRIELFAPGEVGREAVRSILPELRRGLGESGFGASLDLSEHNTPADAGTSGSDARGSDTRDRRPAESPAFPQGSGGEPVRLPRTAVVLPRSSTSSLDILV
ncbi:flagellar hook-length control protein FliK [Arthrobacter sp. AZCC_0090]|uniref:flagellar hook-length control protein FliK n=1 Tax=Arthrobacter sp. AZCC_0090 TaxID=2735881 RepID=UPI00180E5EAB|nr:flagellar hook-length control protein FliK [Arthrobacter sp. AZCC_0090]MBB6404484.1 hypothetical protein [Arthrobacter sp. AZCC_0090]